VYQLDRFARNRLDSATYKAILKNNGVKVLSARENIADAARVEIYCNASSQGINVPLDKLENSSPKGQLAPLTRFELMTFRLGVR
jgi:hypothetical protein